VITLIRMSMSAYDLAYMINNLKIYAQLGFSVGILLRKGVDTLLALI
jgi:hypothetical protein